MTADSLFADINRQMEQARGHYCQVKFDLLPIRAERLRGTLQKIASHRPSQDNGWNAGEFITADLADDALVIDDMYVSDMVKKLREFEESQ